MQIELDKAKKSLFANIKEFFSNSAFATIALVAAASIAAIYYTFNFLIEISSFAVGLGKAALGVFLFWIFDKYAMKEIDTVEQLKNGNIAYAIFLLSLAVLVSAAILGS